MSRYLGQMITYAAFAAGIGLFSVWPEYRMLEKDEALISVTFSHAAKRVGECHELTQAELNELAPNMRRPRSCPRERYPTYIELRANGEMIFSETLLPSGLWSDGKANVYNRSTIKAGSYQLFVGMNDSGAQGSFDYELNLGAEIRPGQNLVVSFDSLGNTFVIE
jgi:hypothetical protein